ncbi:MAG: methylated-DNA--[protein]-cysteine S-methyltransferase [Pontiellaceae bacterium]|nr:methylated-DNA--[protein]-cysteine S-methyltransferase [Pontiellaceae bacterium]MBN2786366.1 methylated-DNA--[protein]-cysteine S-methyltransferase [Pontiellaceae bacterium]
MSSELRIKTSWGTVVLQLDQGLVARCSLPHLVTAPDIQLIVNESGADSISEFIRKTLSGEVAIIPTIRFPSGTAFQQKVWQGIQQIGFGQTCSYGELARKIGCPTAYRAVANACGQNPLPLFIPCHRVIAAHDRLGGFSSGIAWKQILLKYESR